MQKRDTRSNIAHLKNTLGTIKLSGQISGYKTNVPELLGLYQQLQEDEKNDHLKFNKLCEFISEKEKSFPRNRSRVLAPEIFKFDSKGRNIPYRDKTGCPIVDPSVLKVAEKISIDYAAFERSEAGISNPRKFVVTSKTYPKLYRLSQKIIQEDKKSKLEEAMTTTVKSLDYPKPKFLLNSKRNALE